MADSTSERVRRSRAHAKNDHALCRPERCDVAGGRAPAVEAPKSDPTAAERNRRSRKHKLGDHSLCLLGNCNAVTPVSVTDEVTNALGVAPEATPQVADPEQGPEHLADRGHRLWVAMTASWTPSPLHREMLLEACRMADRLEKLDRQLRGEDWLRFWARNREGTQIDVYVDKVLSEARELAAQFRMLAADLVKVATVQPVAQKKGGGVIADIAAKRAARNAHTAG